MKKIVKLLKENKWIHYGIIIVIGILLSLPLINTQIFDTHDGIFHIIRLQGVGNAIASGEIPPVIAPNLCLSFGYAVNLFYPILATYLPLLVKLFCTSYVVVLKLFGAFCIILSGITMYHFSYQVTKKRGIALLASIFYLIAPYKLGDVYRRYAIGEFIALAFLPILFQGVYNLFRQDGKKHYYIAIGASLLVLSHTITTFYVAIFSFIYVLCNIKKLKDKQIIKKLLINVTFIILISTVFWLPIIETAKSTDYAMFNSDIMNTAKEYVTQSTVDIEDFWQEKEQLKEIEINLGLPTIIAFLIGIYAIWKVDKEYKQIYVIFNLFALICLWMTTKYFPWEYMPDVFYKIQFPWRMVGFCNFFASLVCGINIWVVGKNLMKKEELQIGFAIVIIVASVACTLPMLDKYAKEDKNVTEFFEKKVLNKQLPTFIATNKDYFPMKTTKSLITYTMNRENRTYVLEGQAEISNEEKQNLTASMELSNVIQGTKLEFPFIYYPGYEVKLTLGENVNKLKVVESEQGYVSVELTENIEQGKLEVKYQGTFLTKLAYVVSILASIALAVYIARERHTHKVLN